MKSTKHLLFCIIAVIFSITVLFGKSSNQNIIIKGEITAPKVMDSIQLVYSLNNSLNEVNLTKKGHFEFEIPMETIVTQKLPRVKIYFILNSEVNRKYNLIEELPSSTKSIIVLLDTTIINIKVDWNSDTHFIAGGYENKVKSCFDKLNETFQNDLIHSNFPIDTAYKRKFASELKLIQENLRSQYAFEKMYSFLRPSNLEMENELLATLASFDNTFFGADAVRELEKKITTFFKAQKTIDVNFLDFDKINFIKTEYSMGIQRKFKESEYILVALWATWCGPCIEAHKKINKLALKIENKKKLSIIGLAVMSGRNSWDKYIKNNAMQFDMYWIDWGKYSDKFKHLKMNGVPLYLLVRTKDSRIMERALLFENIEKNLNVYM